MCDPQGEPLWLRTWVCPSFSAYAPGEFNNGDPYIVWWDYDWPTSALHAVRFDPEGNVIWQRSYPLENAYYTERMSSFVVPEGAPDAGVLRVFQWYMPTSVIEIGGNGDLLSCTTYDDDVVGGGVGWKMAPTSDGGTLVCGRSDDVPVVFKVDHTGALVWKRRFLLDDGDLGLITGVKETHDGGILLIKPASAFSSARVLKLSADGDPLWARTLMYSSDGASPTDIFEDENGGILLANQGSAAIRPSTYRLSATGDLLSANVLCDNGHSYFTDMEWMEFRAGEVTGMGSITLNPQCLSFHTGLGWFRAPVDTPWPCCGQPLEVVMVEDTVELDTELSISVLPVPISTVTTLYQTTSATIFGSDMCIAMDVGSHAMTAGGLLLWPDPLPTGEPLHISSPVDLDPDNAQLMDAAGRTLPFQLQREGAGRYLIDTGSLSAGHYILSVRTDMGTMAEVFVVME